MKIGVDYLGNGRCEFIVWASFLDKVELKILSLEENYPSPIPLPQGEGVRRRVKKMVFMRRWQGEDKNHVFCFFNFSKFDIKVRASLPKGRWEKILDSSDKIWNGPGTLLPQALYPREKITAKSHSFAVYTKKSI